jgi:hypothetical protein
MAAIYGQTNKVEEAEKIYRILVKKFPKEKDVWIRLVFAIVLSKFFALKTAWRLF